ncbi:MAG: nucleotide exchange factor GrpE [Clostridiales bacterium]|nr:nucleotide exchange factor GrpE [Clostridiales bacterium]MDY5513591.1 nucleotide exchange factor GrpE [Candidatus Ventricola sp.]
MKKKKKTQRAADRTIRERIRKTAGDIKERAMSMNSEDKETLRQEAEPQAAEAPEQENAAKNAQEAAPTVESLTAELEKARAQCDEYLDLAQRKQAEFANYRRRTEGVRQEAYDDGRRDAIEKLLPVVDNLERALSAAGAEESALRDGVDMVLRQTRDALAKMGVEEIDPLGQPFDAELHNAVMQGTAEEGEPGTVCMVLQKGYRLGSRVIRHAMVKVVAG